MQPQSSNSQQLSENLHNTHDQSTFTQTDLKNQAALFVSKLYGNPLIPRSKVQFVLDCMQSFIVNSVENTLRSWLTPLMNDVHIQKRSEPD